MKTESLELFVQAFPGSSFPTLARMRSGRMLLIKMQGSGNGIPSLLAELIVNRLAHRAGWPVPDVQLVEIPEGLPWTFGTDEFDDIVQKSFGLNLGIEFLPESRSWMGPDPRHLPLSSLVPMLALDLLFLNVDRTPPSRNVLEDPQGKIWLIDHGSCVFLFLPELSLDRLPGFSILQQQPELWPMVLDGARALAANLSCLEDMLPAVWLQHEGLSVEAVRSIIERRLIALESFSGFQARK